MKKHIQIPKNVMIIIASQWVAIIGIFFAVL